MLIHISNQCHSGISVLEILAILICYLSERQLTSCTPEVLEKTHSDGTCMHSHTTLNSKFPFFISSFENIWVSIQNLHQSGQYRLPSCLAGLPTSVPKLDYYHIELMVLEMKWSNNESCLVWHQFTLSLVTILIPGGFYKEYVSNMSIIFLYQNYAKNHF